METKLRSGSEAPTGSRTKDVSCWSTDSSAHCLRVEKPGEIHLFPYGYFQHAKLVKVSGDEALHIRFQDWQIIVNGKSLEPLCSALARLAVDRIRVLPLAQRQFPKSEGLIEAIEIHEPGHKDADDCTSKTKSCGSL
jgi:hypothetical protein